jgi:phage terminase large subunit-like protein
MHPVLTMCAANATIVKDPAENRKFTKAKNTGRIDGMVALAMAIGCASSADAGDDAAFNEFLRSATTR